MIPINRENRVKCQAVSTNLLNPVPNKKAGFAIALPAGAGLEALAGERWYVVSVGGWATIKLLPILPG